MQLQIHDPIFGLLQEDSHAHHQYHGEVLFQPNELISIGITFSWDAIVDDSGNVNNENVKMTLSKAHDVYAVFREREPSLRRAIAERAYENDWTAPVGKTSETFTLEEFMSHMKLESILFHDHRIFSVVYDYGTLFGGFTCDEYVDENFNLE